MRIRRRRWLASAAAATAAAAVAWPRVARAAPHVLPAPVSLAAEVAAAVARGQALVVMVSLPGCPWCRLVRESYLVHLRAGGQPVVEVDMTSTAALQRLDGTPATQAQFAQEQRVRTAPTLLFFGRGGKEAAPRLVGVPLPDFYGAYLQERVDAANRAVA